MTVTVLSGHRRVRPYGMDGGEPGALGRHWVEHPDGTGRDAKAGGDVIGRDAKAGGDVIGRDAKAGGDVTVTPMRGCDSVSVAAGEVFVIETPGGGGCGKPLSVA
jgi:5-oxoprolinase (ATP-hydrolysing)